MRELTPEAAAALERWRRYDGGEPHYIIYNCGKGSRIAVDERCLALLEKDRIAVIAAMQSLYPPGYADEITPDRLVKCGGEIDQGGVWRMLSVMALPLMGHYLWRFNGRNIIDQLAPRNMGEVWELLDRLGIDWRKKGGE